MKALIQGIYGKVTGTTNAFNTAIGGRFYFTVAPQEPTFPFSVVHSITDTYDRIFGADIEYATVQFDIYTQESSSSTIGTIAGDLMSLFDWCSLTVTGYTLVEMRRIFSTVDYFSEDGVWQYVVEYRCMLKKN